MTARPYQLLPPLDEQPSAHERDWILKHGVSNLRSLATALARQPGLKFTGVNPAARGRVETAPSWLLAWVRPAETPTGVPLSWWVGVVEYGTGMVAVPKVSMPSASVVPVLKRMGVTETRFTVATAEPASRNPFNEPARRATADDARCVYFIRADGPGLIKIGVAGSARQRLNTLQTGSPVPLTLLAVIPGVGQSAETDLHQMFAADRVRGEWFRPSPALLGYIAENGVRS